MKTSATSFPLPPPARGKGTGPGHEVGPPCIFDLELPRLTLERGGIVASHHVRGFHWGPASDRTVLEERARALDPGWVEAEAYKIVRREKLPLEASKPPKGEAEGVFDPSVPTILVIHALTGDMRPGGPGGFWQPVVGPGLALDPSRHRILCFNNLGSCYGTSGPPDPSFPRAEDPRFPATVTTWDQARSILLALDALGIERIHLVVGGSIGGMIALCLTALAPSRFERVLPIAASEATSAWVIGWNHVARQALLLDPEFPTHPSRGLQLARQIAMLTYRAEPGLHARQGRGLATHEPSAGPSLFRVGGYLEHQGRKLRDRFDAGAYLVQLGAMDHHDLSRPPQLPDPEESWVHDGAFREEGSREAAASWGLSRIRASARIVHIDTDNLCHPAQSLALAERLQKAGMHAESGVIHSPHGHDGFLIEWAQLSRELEAGLDLKVGERE